MIDWIGTPIEPGCRVLYHQKDYVRLGRVVSVDTSNKKAVVRWEKSKIYSLPANPEGTVNAKNLTVVLIPRPPDRSRYDGHP